MSGETFRGTLVVDLGLEDVPEGYQPPRWKRSRRGDVAHHYDCPRATNGMAWLWPENTAQVQTDIELLLELPSWIRPCRVCFDPGEVDWLNTVRSRAKQQESR